MALQVASLFGVLRMDDAQFRQSLQDAKTGTTDLSTRLQNIGGSMQSLGAKMTVMTAPLAVGLGAAVNSAVSFDEAVTNTGAVVGMTREEINALKGTLLTLGGQTREGPQAVAESFYDIVGGVADASTHMDILNAAIATSQAGNSKLTGTTKALISVMNSYKFGADKATFASNVLTRTVGMGVGTMDEFASALPSVTGLANSLGISFDDLASMTAYLTTQGNTAAESTTQLGAMMAALMNPNETMIAALKELGFESGNAAIEALGLTGAYQALADTNTAGEKGMAKMTGSLEAMRGVTSLTGADFAQFAITFINGIEGATAAAQAVQLTSPAAQFDLLQSQVSVLAIKLGDALLPALMDLTGKISPIVDDVIEWIGQNPELTSQILALTVGLIVLGPVMGLVGTIVSGAGILASGAATAFGLLRTAVAILLGPAGILIGLIVGILMAANSLYPGGLVQMLKDAATAAQKLGQILGIVLAPAIDWVKQRLKEMLTTLESVLSKITEFLGITGDGSGPQTQANMQNLLGGVGGSQGLVDRFRNFSASQGKPFIYSASEVMNGLGMTSNNLNPEAMYGGSMVQSADGSWVPSSFYSRDSGGMGLAGHAYSIGTGAQPEVFVPSTNGTFYPNAGGGMGGGFNHYGDVYIQAQDVSDGADQWWTRMDELQRAQG